jgi:hypothetical protein
MLLSWLRMTPGLFQPAKRIGGALAEPQEAAMQSVPKWIAIEWAQATGKFQRQRSVTGTRQIFPQLLLIRRENADAASPARNGDIPLLGVGCGLDGGIGKQNVIHRLAL